MDTFNNVFDLAIIIGGGIILFYAIQMKVNDIIKVGIMVPPMVNVQRMKDREGFKKYAFPRHAFQGIALAVLGMAGITLDLMGRGDIHVIIYGVALLVLLLGNVLIEKGKQKFY